MVADSSDPQHVDAVRRACVDTAAYRSFEPSISEEDTHFPEKGPDKPGALPESSEPLESTVRASSLS